jgi:type VI secretion system FHA domain protein
MTLEHPEELMHEAGALLRELVAGLIGIMMGRAQFKSELRLGVTTIRPVENNPFKFAVDPGDLLERLLLRPSPGFLPALAAAHEAFDDIRAHEMAMTAGLQAALRALLAHFAPAELEGRLSGQSRLDHWLPLARKAHYWDLFTAAYAEVAADAAEDFMRLFGDAFAAAYQEQIEQLAGRRERASTVSRSDT